MKKIAVLFVMLISMAACAGDAADTFGASVNEKTEKIHYDIVAGNIRYVNINGNAKSIVI